ncbi:hypothetical protein B0H21DRAFT_71749 [Amylocystis lapponica]|nr:hypothetical protein B0H21DRAFT_71749 [Amylocystis lapponica]
MPSTRHIFSVLALLCLESTNINAFYLQAGHNNTSSFTDNSLTEREVYDPKITNPQLGTIWTVGERTKVTWDVSQIPSGLSSYSGKLVLGYLENGSDEHLDLDNPLVDGFNITEGHVELEVPNVAPSHDYIVVLFGDSGDRSPPFTISRAS